MTAGKEAAGLYKVRLTEKLIRSLRVSLTVDCVAACRGAEASASSGSSADARLRGEEKDASSGRWRVSSVDWSQDGSTVVLALSPREREGARWEADAGGASGSAALREAERISDGRKAKLLFFSTQTGSLTHIRETEWRSIDAVRFVQGGARKCLVATSDGAYAVVLWALDENVLPIRYSLPAPVVPHTGVDVHPTSDLFLASCIDGTVLLFHLEKAQALGHVRGSSSCPVAAFDCEGLVYACSLGNRKIHLFGCDDDAIEKEPAGQFSSFDLSPFLAPGSHITSLAFGPDEKTLLVCSNRGQVLLIDAFDGNKIHEYHPAQSSQSLPLFPSSHLSSRSSLPSSRPCPPAYTPDGKFLLWGSSAAGGALCVWKAIQSPAEAGVQVPPAHAGRGAERKKSGDPLLVARLRTGVSSQDGEAPGGENAQTCDFVLCSRVHALMITVTGERLSFWQPPVV
ncbi:hypothetical protein BESB_074330 [Besnoitia besnoiti]|uniref:WD-40 repeat protein n=1 Tax=Besnoitia besnoiti TaxID=94643 RepID=A0A2A9MDB0_BESBE|nr:uncharacterized protein BESB_074330 [Besnoitia besnoiti]PFH34281.1 hypothetical protein BESB_074330 [Besnoitia besnoiti]